MHKQCTTNYKPVTINPNYRVGDDGSVWRVTKSGWRKLKGGLDRYGYRFVTIRNTQTGKNSFPRVHQLVLWAFVGPQLHGVESRHYPDPNKENNSLSNLSYCTTKQNKEDNISNGSVARGNRVHGCKLTELDAAEIREAAKLGELYKSIAKRKGISYSHVADIVGRRKWKHVV
jgi:hypothetical protein